jgi:hypothetical protein
MSMRRRLGVSQPLAARVRRRGGHDRRAVLRGALLDRLAQHQSATYPLVHQLAYNAMFIASVSTLLFNANPLLRYDGYYILSDFLEIPNLRQKSMEYTLGLIKRHIFRVKPAQPLPPVGQRAWLLVLFAMASGIIAFSSA